MKWTLELGVAAAITAAVWTLFRALFPGEPLTLGETVFVLAAVYGTVKGLRWLHTRLRPGKAPDTPEGGS